MKVRKSVVFVTLLLIVAPIWGVNKVVIRSSDRAQHLEGWGISLCWWANMCGRWNDKQIDELVDWLVSPDGLNYNIFRYNIGGGDDPLNRHCKPHHCKDGKGLRAEMEGFKDSASCAYDWNRDAAQRKIMLKIKAKRPDAIFEAFSNSCPYYMTYSGCCGGNKDGNKDNLRPECYADFAHYLVDVCVHYKEKYGITFKTLEPFNEPVTDYWYAGGSQEGCHFDVASMLRFVKVLHPILKASGLSTVISATDETSAIQSVKDYRAFLADDSAFSLIGQWNTHTYQVNDEARQVLKALTKQTGLPLWMSEVGQGGKGIQGNLTLSQKLMDDMKQMQPQAWTDWQYVEEKGDQWCLVRGNFQTAEYQRVKNFYVRQQVTRFIRAGYTLLNVDDAHTLAAVSPDNKQLVIVVQNNEDAAVDYSFLLSAFKVKSSKVGVFATDATQNCESQGDVLLKHNALGLTLAPHSIQTFLIKLK